MYIKLGKLGTARFNKVFGLGLSRSGITSLGSALRKLGIIVNQYHHTSEAGGREMMEQIRNGDFNIKYMQLYDSMVDIVASMYFAQLDKFFPDSKYVLTVRDKDKWLDSCRRFWAKQIDGLVEAETNHGFMMTATYGVWKFNADRFSYVYDNHVKNVIDYFRHRQKDLLVLNVTGNSDDLNWAMLCSFLDIDNPRCEFPHVGGGENPTITENMLSDYGKHMYGFYKKPEEE